MEAGTTGFWARTDEVVNSERPRLGDGELIRDGGSAVSRRVEEFALLFFL